MLFDRRMGVFLPDPALTASIMKVVDNKKEDTGGLGLDHVGENLHLREHRQEGIEQAVQGEKRIGRATRLTTEQETPLVPLIAREAETMAK